MKKFDEPMIKVVAFATADTVTTSEVDNERVNIGDIVAGGSEDTPYI